MNIYSQVPDDSNKYDKQLGYSKYIKKLELTNNNNNLAYYINTNGYTEIKVPDGIQGIRAKRFRNKTTLIKLELPE